MDVFAAQWESMYVPKENKRFSKGEKKYVWVEIKLPIPLKILTTYDLITVMPENC